MKTKLLAIAISSLFTLGVQANFMGADHNWNNGSSASKSGKPVGIVKGVMEIAGISRNADNDEKRHDSTCNKCTIYKG